MKALSEYHKQNHGDFLIDFDFDLVLKDYRRSEMHVSYLCERMIKSYEYFVSY